MDLRENILPVVVSSSPSISALASTGLLGSDIFEFSPLRNLLPQKVKPLKVQTAKQSSILVSIAKISPKETTAMAGRENTPPLNTGLQLPTPDLGVSHRSKKIEKVLLTSAKQP